MNPRLRAAFASATTLGLVGCARGTSVEPSAPPPPPFPCAGASLVSPDVAHPVRVAVENRTEHQVRILFDRCLWWTRLGTVEAGATASLRLPDPLLRFGGGLRFQAFTETPTRWYGTYEADFGIPTAHLVVSADNALPVASVPEGARGDEGRAPAVVSRTLAGAAAVSAFSPESFAVLTWRCTAEGAELTFSSGGRLEGDPLVTASFGSQALPFGRWSLIRAYTDGAAPPPEVAVEFTDAVRRLPGVTLLVQVGRESPKRYAFDTRALDTALRGLDCLP